MPVTLTIKEDSPGVTLVVEEGTSGVAVINQEAPTIVISSAYGPGPRGAPGQDGTDGSDANWAAYTQEEYDALPLPDPNTLYVIVPA